MTFQDKDDSALNRRWGVGSPEQPEHEEARRLTARGAEMGRNGPESYHNPWPHPGPSPEQPDFQQPEAVEHEESWRLASRLAYIAAVTQQEHLEDAFASEIVSSVSKAEQRNRELQAEMDERLESSRIRREAAERKLGGFDEISQTEPLRAVELDPGIARYVEALRAAEVETFDSCEGGEGHACPEPVVSFFGDAVEGFRAFAAAQRAGLPVLDLRRYWQIVDGEPCGPYWELSFREPTVTGACSASRAGDRPYPIPDSSARCCCPLCRNCCCGACPCRGRCGSRSGVMTVGDRTELLALIERLRAELWDYWSAYHDEHCSQDWPHPGFSCAYPPPPEVQGTDE